MLYPARSKIRAKSYKIELFRFFGGPPGIASGTDTDIMTMTLHPSVAGS